MRKPRLGSIIVAMAVLATANGVAAADVLRVGGTGAASEMLKRVGAALPGNDRVEVIASLGSSGALRALADSVLDVAISGRLLNADEKQRGLTVATAVRTPFGLVTSHRRPNGLKSTEIAEIFASGKGRWADGTPIRVILRPRSDSDAPLLGSLFPGMAAALEQARRRPDVPTAATDQDNADAAERVPSSLAGATLTQILMEKRSLFFVAIDGIEPTMANFESGQYPHAKTMYFILPAKPKPAAERFIGFLRTAAGRAVLRETGVLPVPEQAAY
jgi:phosphate transport system substrate-binding protein